MATKYYEPGTGNIQEKEVEKLEARMAPCQTEQGALEAV